jgi:hypothetical protein
MKAVVTLICAPLLIAACASTLPVDVPANLKPDPNQALAMIVPARGVQIYECRARKAPGTGHEWIFVAPEAELFAIGGDKIGRHGAGPHWQALDGSRIKGSVKARADAPRTGDIPWLLLSATSEGPTGAFSKITSIQRVNTVGGVAPASPCTNENAGNQVRIEYRADYYFFASSARLDISDSFGNPEARFL